MQIYTFVTKQGQHYWNFVPITGHKQENSVSNTGITTPQSPKKERKTFTLDAQEFRSSSHSSL